MDDLATELGGDLWALVSDAGGFLEISYEASRTRMRVNLDGAFLCMQRAARLMVAQGKGRRVVAMTSVQEHQPGVGAADYGTAEHGLGGLVKNAAIELGSVRWHAADWAPRPART